MQLFLVLITGLALAQTEASPIEENDAIEKRHRSSRMSLFKLLKEGEEELKRRRIEEESQDVVPEKKSMRSMDRSYFRDVAPWRTSYSWGKRSGPQEKRSMMSMDRSMSRPASSYRPSSSSWWGKRSMWSMDRANQRNPSFYKRSPAKEKQAIVDYLRELSDTNNNDAISPEDILALLEQIKEDSEQEAEISQGEHGRVKRGGEHGRVKRGEPFIPAMGAPSPQISMFSRGSGMEIKRLTPSDDKAE